MERLDADDLSGYLFDFMDRIRAIPNELVCNARFLNLNLDRHHVALEISLYLARNNLQLLQADTFFHAYLGGVVNRAFAGQIEAIRPLD